MKIDTEYLVYTDAKGRNPHSHSPTLIAYNQILWSKKTPMRKYFLITEGCHCNSCFFDQVEQSQPYLGL